MACWWVRLIDDTLAEPGQPHREGPRASLAVIFYFPLFLTLKVTWASSMSLKGDT